MSDVDAVARREARRRRILENSQDRLQRIAGKTASPISSRKGSPLPALIPRTENEPEPFTPEFLPPVLNESTMHHNLLEHTSNTPELKDFMSNITSLPRSEPQISPPAAYEKVFITKLDIILLSLIVQLIYTTLQNGLLQSILLPIIVHEVAKMLIVKQRQDSGIIGAMLVMNGISPDNVKKITVMIQYLVTFIQDLCIYLFVTVCTQSLYTILFKKPL